MITAILFVVLILVLIIPHEAGHLIMAKLCDVNVQEFSIGMGPRLWHKKFGETDYSVRLLPLGGYCRMLTGDEEDADPNDPRAFLNKGALQKIAILCAGIVMNILIAWIIITGILAVRGVATNTLSAVPKDMPAYEAGIRVGDTITEVNGNKVSLWSDTVDELDELAKGEPVEITIKRNGFSHTYYMKPVYSKESKAYIIGVTCGSSHNLITAIVAGARSTASMNTQILEGYQQLLQGKLGKDALGGPVKMVQVVNQTRSYGAQTFLLLVAMISINLAIFNAFPIPSLDGARILFVIVRKLSGDRISNEMEAYVHVGGMMLLIALFVFVTFNDISSLF